MEIYSNESIKPKAVPNIYGLVEIGTHGLFQFINYFY